MNFQDRARQRRSVELSKLAVVVTTKRKSNKKNDPLTHQEVDELLDRNAKMWEQERENLPKRIKRDPLVWQANSYRKGKRGAHGSKINRSSAYYNTKTNSIIPAC